MSKGPQSMGVVALKRLLTAHNMIVRKTGNVRANLGRDPVFVLIEALDKHGLTLWPLIDDAEYMTAESFYAQLKQAKQELNRYASLSIRPGDYGEGGGWVASYDHCVGYGDTISDALQATFDHVTGAPSKYAKLTKRTFKVAGRPNEERINYDYRGKEAPDEKAD